MTKKVIDVQNVSKKYYLNQEKKHSTLRESFSNFLKKPFKKADDEFYALKDINFEIHEGDRVGIIGKNGAGKSTLLKVLSRIVQPTSGKIKIYGKVASLLEVGTGFHPELTGRENIFLNGAILGMSRQEIRQKFDDIVAFSEVERFLDTPVKRYSSGMYMRLGFAIAAHLDPDLLIVDEVLAVGDSQFQEKCLKKLNTLSQSGRTILFVSHDIGSIVSLCNKGIFLQQGQIKEQGNIESAVSAYMQTFSTHSLLWEGNMGDEHIRFYKAKLITDKNNEFLYQGEKATFEIEYEVFKTSPDLILGLVIWNQKNQRIARTHTCDLKNPQEFLGIGRHKISFEIDTHLFYEGNYLINLDCLVHNVKHIIKGDISIKLPIYALTKDTRYALTGLKDTIYLGSRWQKKA